MTRGRLSLARLRPPRIPPDAVSRTELVERLLDALDGPLVTVIAGAGYGKTTLLAMAARSDRRHWAWCSCDSRIQDARGLANRLVASVAVVAPGFDVGLDFTGAEADEIGGSAMRSSRSPPRSGYSPSTGRYRELARLAERFGYPPPEIPEGLD